MSRKCKVTGKGPLVGYNVSHAHNKTKMVQRPNLQWKRLFHEDEGRWVRLRVTTRALRTINKTGLGAYLRNNKLKISDLK